MAILMNVTPPEKLLQFRTLVRAVAKTHPEMMPDQARQVLLQEAKSLGIDPVDVRKVLGIYKFASPEIEEQWLSVTEEKFPRWMCLSGQPELGTCWRDFRTEMEFVWIPPG